MDISHTTPTSIISSICQQPSCNIQVHYCTPHTVGLYIFYFGILRTSLCLIFICHNCKFVIAKLMILHRIRNHFHCISLNILFTVPKNVPMNSRRSWLYCI
jgi:hypothetical protein